MVRVISVLLFLICSTGLSAVAQTDSLSSRDSLIIRSREAMNRYFELRALSRRIMDSIEASKAPKKVSKKTVKPKAKPGSKKIEMFDGDELKIDGPSGIDSFIGAFYKFYNDGFDSVQYSKILDAINSTGIRARL